LCRILKGQPPVARAYFEDARLTKISGFENCAGHYASRVDFGCHDGHATTPPEAASRANYGHHFHYRMQSSLQRDFMEVWSTIQTEVRIGLHCGVTRS
jgi:hypothetical protein